MWLAQHTFRDLERGYATPLAQQHIIAEAGGGGGGGLASVIVGGSIVYMTFKEYHDYRAGLIDGTQVHGNSSFSQRPTDLYFLINRTTFDIDKIGITSNLAGGAGGGQGR